MIEHFPGNSLHSLRRDRRAFDEQLPSDLALQQRVESLRYCPVVAEAGPDDITCSDGVLERLDNCGVGDFGTVRLRIGYIAAPYDNRVRQAAFLCKVPAHSLE